MDPNEIAQRLALVTDIKFRVDNVTGDLIESEAPIDAEIMKQALEMPVEEFKQRSEDLRRANVVPEYIHNVPMRAAYMAYALQNPDVTFEQFVRQAIDAVENSKIENI